MVTKTAASFSNLQGSAGSKRPIRPLGNKWRQFDKVRLRPLINLAIVELTNIQLTGQPSYLRPHVCVFTERSPCRWAVTHDRSCSHFELSGRLKTVRDKPTGGLH